MKLDSEKLERRAGFEPANAGFADLSVSLFATGAIETVDSIKQVGRLTALVRVLGFLHCLLLPD